MFHGHRGSPRTIIYQEQIVSLENKTITPGYKVPRRNWMKDHLRNVYIYIYTLVTIIYIIQNTMKCQKLYNRLNRNECPPLPRPHILRLHFDILSCTLYACG